MAFIFDETLLDCGAAGRLALTLAAPYSPPMPAQKYGYAILHKDGAPPQPLPLALFTRLVAASTLQATLVKETQRLAGAVASVLDGLAQSTGEISDDFAEAPSHALALSGGRVLLLFCGKVQPHLLRVVSFAEQRICFEETVAELRSRLKITVPSYVRDAGMDTPVIYASNDDYVLLYLGISPSVLRINPSSHRLERAAFGDSAKLLKDSFELQFTQTHVIRHEHDSASVTLVALQAPHTSREVTSLLAKKAGFRVVCAARGERMALSHPMGVVEVIASDGAAVQVLRPLPMACGKNGANLSLSPDGNYLFMHEDAGTVVLDIDGLRLAEVQLPTWLEIGIDSKNGKNSAASYRCAWQIGDAGTYLLANGHLTHTPWNALEWRDTTPHNPKARKAKAKPANAATTAAMDALLASLARPAVSLKVVKSAGRAARSHLYGTPHLPTLADWPLHAGQPMLLLCELFLADVAKRLAMPGLPISGSLLLFVAVDDDCELLDDDAFAPEAHQVMYCASPAATPLLAPGHPSLAAQALQLTADSSSHPRADSLLLEPHALDAAQQDAYYRHFNQQQPDGASAGHRLGGYPHLLQNNDHEARSFENVQLRYPRTAADWQAASRWQLLLQLDSDENFMWGTDSGILLVMIHADDLARGDFSRTVALTDGC